MKTVFFGTPEFSTPFLTALIDDPIIEVVAVVTQPDKVRGREKGPSPCPVKVIAQAHSIPVLQPVSLKTDPTVHDTLKELGADLFVVVAYGKFLPKSILQLPPHGSVNVHPSLLPRHRGPSPMQWAIAQGDVQTGISIMLLDEGMDTGPLLATTAITLDADETYTSLQKKVHLSGPSLLVTTLKQYLNGTIHPVPQQDKLATTTRLLKKEDGHIDWDQPMARIERQARAYEMWPGAWSVWKRSENDSLRLKWTKMRCADFTADVPPGTVVIENNQLFVDTADGTIEILEVQPEGKPKMNAQAFIQGYQNINGAQLV
jgi:methionyl-tRNA formyltransferase